MVSVGAPLVCGRCGCSMVRGHGGCSVVSVGVPRFVVDVGGLWSGMGVPWSVWARRGSWLVWVHCFPAEGHLVAARISVL